MILLTGATGYIGSHTWIEMINAGYDVLGVDNLSNSNIKVIERIKAITNQKPKFIQADVCDKVAMSEIFGAYSIDVVVHFAALKAVGESVQKPIEYYRNNLGGLLSLSEVMHDHSCSKFVFSSSATVYHPSNPIPYREGMPLGSTSPYGWSKYLSPQSCMVKVTLTP